MSRLIGAELLKLRTTWSWWLLLGLAVLLAAFQATITVFLGPESNAQMPSLDTVEGLRFVYSNAGNVTPFLLVLGILGITTEYRHATITSTFLAVPRRARVLWAKFLTYPLVGLGYAVLVVGLAVGAGALTLRAAGHEPLRPGVNLPGLAAGAVIGLVLYVVIGLGLGALVRNQIAAIVGGLVWFNAVESLVVVYLPQVGKWLPGGGHRALLQVGTLGGERGDLLAPWAGGLLFLAWGVAFTVLAMIFTLRRDVT